MQENKYKIESVEFYYNGKNESFDMFLKSVLRDYISEDKIAPDVQVEYPIKKSA